MQRKALKLLPTGVCWCGCGQDLPRGSFFSPGHDKRAEARVIREKYGSVANFLAAHGLAPAPKPASREESQLDVWLDLTLARGSDRVAADLKRLQGLGVLDAQGRPLKSDLPGDMKPGTETRV